MLAKNLKYLRKKNRISQLEMAKVLGLKRTAVGDYERSTSNPSIETLVKIASHFGVSIDSLLKEKIYNDEHIIVADKSLKVLAISVDAQHNNMIDLVKTKAEAGYLESFNDPEFIMDLPKISMPNIPKGTYRAFEINGDSMEPIRSGSVIICSYVEQLADIKDDKTYIVISKADGLVYKRVKKDITQQRLILSSDNAHYLPYEISLEEVGEVWQYYAHISFSDDKPQIEELKAQLDGLDGYLQDMRKKLEEL